MTDLDARVSNAVLDHGVLLTGMRLAARAPSVHNTQPWRWEFDDRQLRLYRADGRSLPSADPHGRQLVISCGAMLHHVSTAFAALGHHSDITLLPTPGRPDHLATLTFRPWADPPADVLARAEAIERRHTDRLPFDAPGDLSALVRRARSLAETHHVMLDVLGATAPARLRAASEQSTALRHYDMPYQAELGWWTGHDRRLEGIPTEALISDSEARRVPVGRRFPGPARSGRRGDLEDHAELWLLATEQDSVLDWLETGEALSAVLLECTAAGLATCPVTHITELPATRRLIANLAPGQGLPQVVVRVGIAPDRAVAPATPRRPPSDFLIVRHDGESL